MRRFRTILGRRRIVVLAVLVLVGLGATTVGALSARGSRELTQSSDGVTGSAETGDYFGVELAIGDFDGDGRGDVVAAAPYENLGAKRDAGQIQVLYGSSGGVSTAGDDTIHQGTRNVVGRSVAGDLFGSALAVGDFNNDDYDDLAVGVPGKTVLDQPNAGWVIVLYGNARGLSGRGSVRIGQDSPGVDGEPGAGDWFGHSLTSGDFNNDGFDDVAVGAPGDDDAGASWAGSATVLYGSASGVSGAGSTFVHQGVDEVADDPEAGDEFGWALAAADVNGDGFDDLAAAAPGESIDTIAQAGIVHVLRGSPTGVVVEGNVTLHENTPGVPGVPEAHDRFGTSIDGGDFDGGGVGDLAVGVAGEAKGARTASGVVHVMPGTDGVGITGAGTKRLSQAKGVPGSPQAGDEFGYRVTVGDFNGNGRDDLAVGAPGETIDGAVGAGATHVFFGSATGITKKKDELWQPGVGGLAGVVQPNGGAGRALAAGDIDGDGRDDLVIGVPGRTTGSRSTSGSFVVLYG